MDSWSRSDNRARRNRMNCEKISVKVAIFLYREWIHGADVETQGFDCRNIRTSPKERSKTVKKLTLITMFFVLLLGTRCQALSSARATFFGKHECHAAGSHAQRCRINSGDTLSKDALAVYGDWHLYSTILMGANPQIVDANKIYAGKWIIIPDQPTSVVKTVAVLTPEKMAISAPADISTENHFSPLPSPEAPASIPVPVEKPVPTSTQIVIALDPKVSAASIVTQPPIVAQPPPTPKEVRAKTTKPKKVSGYRFVIPNSHAFISDGTPIIPMGLDLPTQVGIFNKADDVENNIPPLKTVNVVSRAEAIKGNNSRCCTERFAHATSRQTIYPLHHRHRFHRRERIFPPCATDTRKFPRQTPLPTNIPHGECNWRERTAPYGTVRKSSTWIWGSRWSMGCPCADPITTGWQRKSAPN